MKLLKPVIPPSLTTYTDIDALLDADELISAIHLDNAVLAGVTEKSVVIQGSLISKTDLSQVQLERFDVHDCVFKNCNFSVSKFPSSRWHSVSIESARCSGMQITDSRLRNVVFKGSKLELMNFRFSNLENILFEDCYLNDIDFYNATLKNIVFKNCTITNITFASARMSNVNVARSQIERINGLNSLKGVTISQTQLMELAPLLAAEAGIKVEEVS